MKKFRVFDLGGEYLGTIEADDGSDAAQKAMQRFKQHVIVEEILIQKSA